MIVPLAEALDVGAVDCNQLRSSEAVREADKQERSVAKASRPASSRTQFSLNGTLCGKLSASARSRGPYGSGRHHWQRGQTV
jgi:hypothetical protein